MQRNWIGRSEGAQFRLAVEGRPDLDIEVFTTRPDTSFGMTYAVLAPEHPLVAELVTDAHAAGGRGELRARAVQATDIERLSSEGTLEKRGAFTGSYCVNPFNDQRLPDLRGGLCPRGLWHRSASWPYQPRTSVTSPLPRHTAYRSCGRWLHRRASPAGPIAGDGLKINSGFLDGLDVSTAKRVAIDLSRTAQASGRAQVNYRLRDWLISRQRYWGCPIPVVYCPDHGAVPAPVEELPILLPDDVEFRPTGESPLRFHEGFLQTTCPHMRRAGDPEPTPWTRSWTRPGISFDSAILANEVATRRPRCRSPFHARRPVHRRHHACDLCICFTPCFFTRALGGHRPRAEAGS